MEGKNLRKEGFRMGVEKSVACSGRATGRSQSTERNVESSVRSQLITETARVHRQVLFHL